MAESADKAELCDFCRTGRVVRRAEEIAFHQETDRGTISCRVTIPMGICENCGAKSWDEVADAIIEEAVRREYDGLA